VSLVIHHLEIGVRSCRIVQIECVGKEVLDWNYVEVGDSREGLEEEGRVSRLFKGNERGMGYDLEGVYHAPEELKGRAKEDIGD